MINNFICVFIENSNIKVRENVDFDSMVNLVCESVEGNKKNKLSKLHSISELPDAFITMYEYNNVNDFKIKPAIILNKDDSVTPITQLREVDSLTEEARKSIRKIFFDFENNFISVKSVMDEYTLNWFKSNIDKIKQSPSKHLFFENGKIRIKSESKSGNLLDEFTFLFNPEIKIEEFKQKNRKTNIPVEKSVHNKNEEKSEATTDNANNVKPRISEMINTI